MNEIADYWNARPCNVGHSDAPIGSSRWSAEVTSRKYFVEPHIPNFALFRCWQGKYVLEIGCGIGTDTIQFAIWKAHVLAVDISAKSIALAHERLLPHSLTTNYELFCLDAEQWLPPGPFDLVYSFGVLHHTTHPEKVLRLAHDRMKDSGELRIMVYAKYSWKHFWRMQPEAQPGCPYVHWYSKREARKLLESCGFRVVSIRKTHIFPWRIKEYRQHCYKKAFPWSITPQWLFRWLESRIGHHLLVIAVKQ